MRLYVPGARLVSARQVAGVAEVVGHTVAARGKCCVYGDTGVGKTVAAEQALHLPPGRVRCGGRWPESSRGTVMHGTGSRREPANL